MYLYIYTCVWYCMVSVASLGYNDDDDALFPFSFRVILIPYLHLHLSLSYDAVPLIY